LIQSEVSSNEDADASNLTLEIWDNKNNTKNIFSSLNIKNNDTLNSTSTNDNNKYNSLFTIDIQPNTDKQSNIDLDIPVYHNQVRYIFMLSCYILLFLSCWKHINVIINLIKIIDIFLMKTDLIYICIYIFSIFLLFISSYINNFHILNNFLGNILNIVLF
jgi:hypothetical protein